MNTTQMLVDRMALQIGTLQARVYQLEIDNMKKDLEIQKLKEAQAHGESVGSVHTETEG